MLVFLKSNRKFGRSFFRKFQKKIPHSEHDWAESDGLLQGRNSHHYIARFGSAPCGFLFTIAESTLSIYITLTIGNTLRLSFPTAGTANWNRYRTAKYVIVALLKSNFSEKEQFVAIDRRPLIRARLSDEEERCAVDKWRPGCRLRNWHHLVAMIVCATLAAGISSVISLI